MNEEIINYFGALIKSLGSLLEILETLEKATDFSVFDSLLEGLDDEEEVEEG